LNIFLKLNIIILITIIEKKPVNKGYPLDDFLQQNKKYFSYKTMILDTDDYNFEVEIIFHDNTSEILYFLQN
jgi:hypothetical protein